MHHLAITMNPAGLLASESVSSGIWLWWLAVAVMVILTLASAASFLMVLRRSKPSHSSKQECEVARGRPV